MLSPNAGGYDFDTIAETSESSPILWDPRSLPSVVAVAQLPVGLADSKFRLPISALHPLGPGDDPLRLIAYRGTTLRAYIADRRADSLAVVLPLDQLFDIRAAAALRLWHGLIGRPPRHDPAELPATRRDRLVLALRALDGRLERATYRDIAEILFGSGRMPERGWKTHDLRDRTVRLARLGFSLMKGGYRRLLLYPFRGRL